MNRRNRVLGSVVLGCCLFVVWILVANPGAAQRPDAASPAFTGKAVFVLMKGSSPENALLEDPQIKTFGERSFLIGRVVRGQRRLWLPLSDIARIEEFSDVEALGKHYQLGAPPKKNPD